MCASLHEICKSNLLLKSNSTSITSRKDIFKDIEIIASEERFLKEVKNSGGLDTMKTPTARLLLFYNEGKSIAVGRAVA